MPIHVHCTPRWWPCVWPHPLTCLLQRVYWRQFSSLNGSCCTLFQSRKCPYWRVKTLQIIDSHGNHRIAVSTAMMGQCVCMTLFMTHWMRTQGLLCQPCLSKPHPVELEMIQSQKQEGGRDCGLFYSLDHCSCFSSRSHVQSITRQHLVQCMEKQTLIPFPTK